MGNAADSEDPQGPAKRYDCIVIGCGMAGLAAAIRLAMYDRRVLVLESHNAPGGLNSFFFQAGRKCDVGLHAVTNYVDPGTKGTPLTKLLRQLRIPREAFDLSPQVSSAIVFPGNTLHFENGISRLESEIADQFPSQIDAFRNLRRSVLEHNAFDLDAPVESARERVRALIQDPLLEDMLFCPLMYYGSAREMDMDWEQFVIMWHALYEEGFGRPLGGVRVIIKALLDRLREVGAERKMKSEVSEILREGDRTVGVRLATGEEFLADTVISTIGLRETEVLAGLSTEDEAMEKAGQLGYVETMSFFPQQPVELGWKDTILFFNTAERFQYRAPREAVDPSSGVICFPNNYQYGTGLQLDEGILRVTALARPDAWIGIPEDIYLARKEEWFERLQSVALSVLPPLSEESDWKASIQHKDMFTPRTVKKYTRHFRGTIYGSPEKRRDGKLPLEGLFLAGTDQGFLGIIGAMLSGISMANAHGLRG